MSPLQCPICRSASITRILRDIMISARVSDLVSHSSGALAYRCDTGHIFLVIDDAFRWGETQLDTVTNPIMF